MNPPRLIIAAPMSGKTTVTAGLIAALTRRGLRVAPFKADLSRPGSRPPMPLLSRPELAARPVSAASQSEARRAA